MAEVVVHEMQYYGGKVSSDIEVVSYSDKYYDDNQSLVIIGAVYSCFYVIVNLSVVNIIYPI